MLTNIRRRFLTMGGTIVLCVLSFVAVSATPAFASTTQTASSATATFQSANPPGPGRPNRGPGQPNRGPGRGGNSQACPATVSSGDSGQAVRTLQRLLHDRGFKVRVTGQFDGQTRSAVRQFQRQHHWDADGVAGDAVWQALGQC